MAKQKTLEQRAEILMSSPTDVVKKKRVFKKREVKPTWEILHKSESKKLEQLFRIYKENPFYARVFYLNDVTAFSNRTTFYFDYGPNHFEVAKFERVFGISKTNRMFSREKKVLSFIYKDNKFWIYKNSGRGRGAVKDVKPLCFSSFYNHVGEFGGNGYYHGREDGIFDKLKEDKVFKIFNERFFWFKLLLENRFAGGVIFNTIVSKKLFGLDKLNRHIFNMTKDISKRLIESNILFEKNFNNDVSNRLSNYFYQLKNYLPHIDNIQFFDFNLMGNHIFHDTINMGKKLGRNINGKWGLKKLTEVHDSWSVELQNILLDCEIEEDLKVSDIFKSFAEYSGYKLLHTNKELLAEGMRQNHCVGTYIDSVRKGDCAIFDVEDYTLQLKVLRVIGLNNGEYGKPHLMCRSINSKDGSTYTFSSNYNIYDIEDKKGLKYILNNVQFKGKHNKDAPKELVAEVNKKLIEFSKFYDWDGIYESVTNEEKDETIKSIINREAEEMFDRGFEAFQINVNADNLPF